MATVLKTFDKWKEFLNERVEQARSAGMTDETIKNLAAHIGDFLANKVDPENDEERILKQLWEVANENEQKTIAGLMMKLVTPGK